MWDVNPTLQGKPPEPGSRTSYPKVPAGWLCFDDGRERRRLSPVPKDWPEIDDITLETLCSRAEIVPAVLRDLDPRAGESNPGGNP